MEVHYLRSKVGTTISRMVADQRPQDGIDWMDWLFLGQPGELLLENEETPFWNWIGCRGFVRGCCKKGPPKWRRNIDRGRLSKA